MLGSKFLIESLAVNPQEVIAFAPTELQMCRQGPGHAVYSVDIDSPIRDRDPRGYNRAVMIQSFGLSTDFAAGQDAINAYELLIELLLDATANGFDYQWSKLETKGAEGANPDIAEANIYLTAFQFEDFKHFMRNRLQEQDRTRFFRIDFVGITENSVSFLSPDLIEVILELEYEWKSLLDQFNLSQCPQFETPKSVGALTRIRSMPSGKTQVRFEVRSLPQHTLDAWESAWREKVQGLFAKYHGMSFSVTRDRAVPALHVEEAHYAKNSNALSDAGWFAKSKFPVSVVGAGSIRNLPKGPNESIRLEDLDRAIHYYKELILSLCQ
jgi:hypothetical protein